MSDAGLVLTRSLAYTEDADGFQFARKKVERKTPVAEATAEAGQSAPGAMSAQDGGKQADASNERPAQPAKKRKRRFSEAIREESARPRRRSARLSGEKVQAVPPDPTPTPATPEVVRDAVVHVEETESKEDEAGLRVEKRRATTKIALPFADTPVITRNKEMRKNSGAHRRSSTGLRGRRASSLIESGTSNGMSLLRTLGSPKIAASDTLAALPHREVDIADFYKHISQDDPEPRRMRQLLTWCATRALSARPTNGEGDVTAILAGKHTPSSRGHSDERLRSTSDTRRAVERLCRQVGAVRLVQQSEHRFPPKPVVHIKAAPFSDKYTALGRRDDRRARQEAESKKHRQRREAHGARARAETVPRLPHRCSR